MTTTNPAAVFLKTSHLARLLGVTSATILNAVRDGRWPIPAHRIGNGTSGLLFAKDDVVKQWPPLAGFIGQDQMADRAAAGLVSMDLDQKAAERRLVTP